MKTIEEAALEYCSETEENWYKFVLRSPFDSFKAGARFAQRWIPIEEELPDEKNGYINKEVIAFTSDNCAYVLIYDDYIGWLPNGTDADIDNITHWRPIEIA